jgi:DNA-3-methyladenine glycosylase I
MSPKPQRCAWAGDDPQMVEYHDREWGVPVHDEQHLFEMLTLEGAQAGLSWRTILRKRAAYRAAFAEFDPARVARFGARDVTRLLSDAGIVRNRLKIESTIANARAIVTLEKNGSLDALVWSFVGGKTLRHSPRTLSDVPATTAESNTMSKALRAQGFRFVGPTICYAFMQACGLVDDHMANCFRGATRAATRARSSPRA